MLIYGVEFDDFTHDEDMQDCGLRTYWSQICDKCYHAHEFDPMYVSFNEADGICGVKGCNNEADHYIDYYPCEITLNIADELDGE